MSMPSVRFHLASVCIFMSLSPNNVREGVMFLSIRLSGQISLPRYLMNGVSSLDETYCEYSLAPY